MTRRTLLSTTARRRLEAAQAWLAGRPRGEEVLVVAASPTAAGELLRRAALAAGGAAFGWHRATLPQVAAELAAPRLAERGAAPLGRLGSEAAVTRAVDALAGDGGLGRFARVAGSPGLPRALAAALAELRRAGLGADDVEDASPELAALARAYAGVLADAGLADRAELLRLATEVAGDPAAAHPWLGLPLLLVDPPLAGRREAELVAALAGRAPEVLATLPAGDAEAVRALEDAVGGAGEDLDAAAETAESGGGASALERLQRHLFAERAPAGEADASVTLLSAPGESRECVELARQILAAAGDGVPFDAMAVLLRSPGEYAPHLEEALSRARVPAWFARGVVRPDPAGRAFLALLRTAAEGLSAARFAEYLSLAQVPDLGEPGAEAPGDGSGKAWQPPDDEILPERLRPGEDGLGAVASEDAAGAAGEASDPAVDDPETAAVIAGAVRAPRRWERLLVEAAVLGGRERWRRRLEGLGKELERRRDGLEDPDDPARDALDRQLTDLEALSGFALPLVDRLAELPAEAPWGDWLERLAALAESTLARPERVLATLAQLAPLGPVGPVPLGEVVRVLERELSELTEAPPASRHGAVFVAPAEAARGLSFDLVFVPGLAERLFPRKVGEEPILLDRARRALPRPLPTNEERIARERLALRLAVGAARRRVVLSWPRIDLDQGRPRVPSFYALEAVRAAEGRLPRFDELARRAEEVGESRVGWPAPERAELAIDEAEYDLAVLAGVLHGDRGRARGAAHYLLAANPHLARALRFRARRWLKRWSPADGLVEREGMDFAAGAREALAGHRLAERSFSPTALQHFAVCPYRFFLYAVMRLAPRDVPTRIEELDPLERGSLVHEVQFRTLSALRDEGLLPLDPDRLEPAREVLGRELRAVERSAREELAPAIERVWRDGIGEIRADLAEWLERVAADRRHRPWRFELAFGLGRHPAAVRADRDAASRDEPVEGEGGRSLRGSIDLVERAEGGRLRVTDHKTGRARVPADAVIHGGRALQPALYALAAEALFPDAGVDAGRLWYCTSKGEFEERQVPLDDRARAAVRRLAATVGGALDDRFLPAAPEEGACRWCDYLPICGPYEERRSRRKPQRELEALHRLRREP